MIELVNNFVLVPEGVTRALKRIVSIIKIPLAFSTEISICVLFKQAQIHTLMIYVSRLANEMYT